VGRERALLRKTTRDKKKKEREGGKGGVRCDTMWQKKKLPGTKPRSYRASSHSKNRDKKGGGDLKLGESHLNQKLLIGQDKTGR